ncbi:hypothetical protein ACRRTK_003786 [Alexandromys fortis]
MFLKAVVLTLALVAITGTRAEVSEDQVATVVWDYFIQLGNNAKEAMEKIQKSDITQQLKCSDREQGLQTLRRWRTARLHNVTLAWEVNTQAQELKRQLTPYMQRMQTTLQENVDNLQASMTPFANEFKDKFNQNVEELKASLTPRASELKATIDQNLQELRSSLAPLAEGVQEKLNHQLEGLAFQMKKNAEELQTKVSTNIEQLQKKLAPLVEDVHSKLKGNTEGLQKSLEDLNSQLDQQVEEFRRTVEPLGEMFNKALVQQMEQFRQQLGSNSGDVQSHLSFLEKNLREKVSFFMGSLEKKESPDQTLALPVAEQVQEPNPKPSPVES